MNMFSHVVVNVEVSLQDLKSREDDIFAVIKK